MYFDVTRFEIIYLVLKYANNKGENIYYRTRPTVATDRRDVSRIWSMKTHLRVQTISRGCDL